MRKLILQMHSSLDGFVEGPNGDMSWMQPDNAEDWNESFELFNNVDLYILGAGMWNEYRDYWKRALKEPGFSENEVKYAKLAEKTKHIVFSKSMKDPGWENTEINSGELETELKKLKEAEGKFIQVVGGGQFASACIDTGLIDEYRIFVDPVIVGGGKPLFDQLTKRHRLQIISSKQLETGVILLNYKQVSSEDKNVEPKKIEPQNK